jgi:plasmid stabilization system protein ParE
MSRKIRFSRAARLELDEAIAWYEGKQPGQGSRLDNEVDSVLQIAAERPERFAKVTMYVRKARLRKFHCYAIYFTVSSERIDVVAVYHGKRDPDALRNRLK